VRFRAASLLEPCTIDGITVLGAGFSFEGVYDFNLLKKILKNLLIATVASLVVSTVCI
jgi:hypothetical protein